MVVPLTVTASLRLDSQLFRWNIVHNVLAVLSLSLATVARYCPPLLIHVTFVVHATA